MTADVYIFDAVRTARGKARPGGGLAAVRPVELVASLCRTLAGRRGVGLTVEDLILGCVTQVGDQGANIARSAALWAGWDQAPGLTVNRFCASGLDAVRVAAGQIATGAASLVAAGGVESMSRVGLFTDRGAWFADPVVARATGYVHMGLAADLLATQCGLTRAALDAFAVESHRRAAAARDAGHFERPIVPVAGCRHDELIRDGASLAGFAALEPAFATLPAAPAVASEGPGWAVPPIVADRLAGRDLTREALHTVATSPGMCDGASLVLVGNRAAADRHGMLPRARLVASASVTVDPVLMLAGNVPAIERVLAQADLTVADIDVFEVNESFAAVPLHLAATLGIPLDRLNPCGGALALGHPLGATGGILIATLLDELDRRDARRGIVSICGGAGVATALLLERLGP